MAPARKKQRLSEGDDDAANPVELATQQGRSLFVRSLPATATSEVLTELFSDQFAIKHATAVIDPETKQCRGYGFVTFADAEDAQRAKTEFNGHVLDGKKLRIELAEARQREGEGADGSKKTPREKREHEGPQPTKLIVRNLPWTIKGSNQLEKLFLSYGKVKLAYVPKKGPGLMAGFGFVVMRGKKSAERAIEGVNGKLVDGRTLAVDWAVEKGAYAIAEEKTEEVEPEDADAGAEDEEETFGGGAVLADEGTEHIDDMDDEASDADSNQSEVQDVDMDDDAEEERPKQDDKSATLFVRNLPFTCTDEDLEDHFSRFGSTRYARVVMDPGTDRSKGTGFVCFYKTEDADACMRGVPRRVLPTDAERGKDSKSAQPSNSILQNENADPSGEYTLDGRVLQVSRAVNKNEASRLTSEGDIHRKKRDNDKRRLYLLSEGTINTKSALYDKLSPSEKTMREASAKQRKSLIESNPSLHMSLTRLSIRNLPRSIGSKELKALAREAVVGFATDVKAQTRSRLSKEELARGGDEMVAAEAERKKGAKGIVRQAKVVYEGSGGSKVSEDTGAGRSRGYGFVEYYTHRSALMGLRWLNGHSVGYQVQDNTKGKLSKDDMQDRKKRLIVEFAIENAQVVLRRKESETKARERSRAVQSGATGQYTDETDASRAKPKRGERKGKRGPGGKPMGHEDASGSKKRKRGDEGSQKPTKEPKKPVDEKLVKRNQIIGRKRAMRKKK